MAKTAETQKPNHKPAFDEAKATIEAGHVPAEGTALAVRSTAQAPMILEESEAAFLAYADKRDKFLNTTFSHNTSLARSGAKFTVIDADATVMPDLETGEAQEVYAYYVRLQDAYSHEDRKTAVTTEYEAGTEMLIMMRRNSVRDKDFNRVVDILRETGTPIPNLVLNEYLTKDPLKNNATGIAHVSQWRHIRDVMSAQK